MVEAIQASLAKLMEGQSRIDTGLSTLSTDVTAIKSDLASSKEAQAAYQSKNDARLDALDAQFALLKARLDDEPIPPPGHDPSSGSAKKRHRSADSAQRHPQTPSAASMMADKRSLCLSLSGFPYQYSCAFPTETAKTTYSVVLALYSAVQAPYSAAQAP